VVICITVNTTFVESKIVIWMTLQHVIITSIIIVLIMSFSHQRIQLCLCKMSDLPGMGWEWDG